MTSPTPALRAAVALSGVYAASQICIAALLLPLGRDVLRMQATTDPDELGAVMTGWTPEQRAQYRKHLPLDMVHPLLYAGALTAAGAAGHTPSTPRWVRAAAVAVPAASAVCDLAENVLHAGFVSDPRRATRSALRASTAFTCTKWVLSLGTAGALAARSLHRRWGSR